MNIEDFQPVIRYDIVNGRIEDGRIQILHPQFYDKHYGMVYLRVVDGEIIYGGKCEKTLHRRFREHVSLYNRKPNKNEMFQFINGKTVTWYARPVPDGGAASEEVRTIKKFKPRFNKRIG